MAERKKSPYNLRFSRVYEPWRKQEQERQARSLTDRLDNMVQKLPAPTLKEEQAWRLLKPFLNPNTIEGWPKRYKGVMQLVRDYHAEQFQRLHPPTEEQRRILEGRMERYPQEMFGQARPALRFILGLYDRADTLRRGLQHKP